MGVVARVLLKSDDEVKLGSYQAWRRSYAVVVLVATQMMMLPPSVVLVLVLVFVFADESESRMGTCLYLGVSTVSHSVL